MISLEHLLYLAKPPLIRRSHLVLIAQFLPVKDKFIDIILMQQEELDYYLSVMPRPHQFLEFPLMDDCIPHVLVVYFSTIW